MDDHDARYLAFALSGQADPGEDTRRLSIPSQGVVEDGADRAIGLEAYGLVGLGRLSAGIDESEHYLAIGGRFSVRRDGE